MSIRFIPTSAILLFLVSISGCQENTPSFVSVQAAPTLTVPTLSPEEQTSITVPQGTSPIIDGTLLPGEWDRAKVEIFSDNSELLLMHGEGYLYLGIRANTTDMIVGNIFVDRGDEIAVLHTSAALGTAIYQKDAEIWQQTQGFSWCCRSTNSHDAAQAERDAFLQQEHWVSINSRMGTPQELEYQIEMTNETLRLAVTFMLASGINQKFSWPTHLKDACVQSFEGGFPLQLQFSPDTWETITIQYSGETDKVLLNENASSTPLIPDTASLGDSFIRPGDSMTMVFVPGGSFSMGSTGTEIEDAISLCNEFYSPCNRWYYEREAPRHPVNLDDFWIDQTEVINAQYRQCAEAGICAEPLTCKKGEPTFNDPEKTDHPVVCVDWEGAKTYCQWAGGRLPTEAEWEYAFRGEASVTYPWGDEFDGSKLNYCDANCGQPHADNRFDDGYPLTALTGSYPSGASWAGVLDMGGNVSEWVADWFGEYSLEAVSNPAGPESGNEKMLKGCSWFFHPTYCRGALRPSVSPDTRFDYLGFRCATSSPITETVTPEQNSLGDNQVRASDGMTVFFVPAGIFDMGAAEDDPDAADDEMPQHTVTLDAFWVDQTEVTNAQYAFCVEQDGCRKSLIAGNPSYNGSKLPVTGVSWQDAFDYCDWAGGRIPTEAEWEYASKGKDNSSYPWGNEFNGNFLNFCDVNCDEEWADTTIDDGYTESAPVGSFLDGASWVGALDMAGNVWEWVWDWCGAYSANLQTNPHGSQSGNCKIIRGGAWASPQAGVRTTYRMIGSAEISPTIRHPNIGFRCVMDVDGE